MALSGLDIYKLLPKTNCKECGFATCLALAMQLAKKAVRIDKCPYVTAEARRILETASQPPIRLVTVGKAESMFQSGQETVMFRHEEKFHNPCAVGIIIDADLSPSAVYRKVTAINNLSFERVGQRLSVDLIAVRQAADKACFVETVKQVVAETTLAVMLMSDDVETLEAALLVSAAARPLLYHATRTNIAEIAALAKRHEVPLVVTEPELRLLEEMTKELVARGVQDLVLDVGGKPLARKISDFTLMRRQALKKGNRAFGFPLIAVVGRDDPLDEIMEAAAYTAKYASIILLRTHDPAHILSLLTLRQNMYADPQKPLQIEPNVYPVGPVSAASPVLVTTNFSLSYYTVMGSVEAGKVPSYILSVNTEGMSVLTAWAAEKFTPERIAAALDKFNVAGVVSHKKLVIPGYVAVISGELAEASGWEVIVGPKEASGIPSFLKKL